MNVSSSLEQEIANGLMRPDFVISSTMVKNFVQRNHLFDEKHQDFSRDVVLEVDGPHHFAISASTGHRSLLGPTVMRNFLLERVCGVHLGVILYDEWGNLESAEQRDTYMRELLIRTIQN